MQAYILKKSHVAAEFSQGSTLKKHMATHTREEKNFFLQGVWGKGKSSEDTYGNTYAKSVVQDLQREVI